MASGRWDLDKRPVVWEYKASLECAICHIKGSWMFRAEANEGAQPSELTGKTYPGEWRRFGFAGSHTDPLAEKMDVVVCSKQCAEKFVQNYVEELYAEPHPR